MATLGAWAIVAGLAVAIIAAAYAVLVTSGVIGQRAAAWTGRGWMGAAIGLSVLAAAIGAEAWLFRDHIHCGPNGCHEDSYSSPEYP